MSSGPSGFSQQPKKNTKKISSGFSDQQLHQEIQNELLSTNELLHSIMEEIQKIKIVTSQHGELAANVEENANVLEALAHFQNISLGNTSPPKQTVPK